MGGQYGAAGWHMLSSLNTAHIFIVLDNQKQDHTHPALFSSLIASSSPANPLLPTLHTLTEFVYRFSRTRHDAAMSL